ncbi:MAG: hypothetical protein QOF31_2806, partial [Mycobacterium sp.]|nr:hypothetical protein [Mycobacterium sp.]
MPAVDDRGVRLIEGQIVQNVVDRREDRRVERIVG